MRYFVKRLFLLWKFVKLIPEARTLELEIQSIQQKMHDIAFSNDLHRGQAELELAKQSGLCEGIEWCLKRFS